jgi:membrane protease YdiL (CAAX protease family)
MFGQPGLLLGGFATLLLAGLILGYARARTRSLWMPIGLHAGWIVGEKGLMAVTRRSVEWPWLGPDIPNTLVGLAPLLTLLITWGIVWWMLRDAGE